jgi:hypothetical protein
MKKKLQTTGLLLLAFTTLLFNGCKKEGPAGPAGNANVTATTFTISSWSWSSPYYYVNLTVPALTSANMNAAAVMVYIKATGTSWTAVPYTQYDTPDNYFMGFNTNTNNVQLTWIYDNAFSSGDDPNVVYGTQVRCKVVVIPPAERKANPNINLYDYEAVKKAYHLED